MSTELSSGNDLVRKSSLYREFQAEREEIVLYRFSEPVPDVPSATAQAWKR